MTGSTRLAFYDFDGTLSSSNVVARYLFFARRQRPPFEAARRLTRLAIRAPLLLLLELASRGRFNQALFREYRGLRMEHLLRLEPLLFEQVIRSSLYPQVRGLLDDDRADGFEPVLISGELDVALTSTLRHLGINTAICNRLESRAGRISGRAVPPLIAGQGKVAAARRLCGCRGTQLAEARAYADSLSDLPLLEAVGEPVAVNPDRRLRTIAMRRNWPILDLARTHR